MNVRRRTLAYMLELTVTEARVDAILTGPTVSGSVED